jgi:hypothetical protein
MTLFDLSRHMHVLNDCPRLSFNQRKEHGILPNDMRFLPKRPILICKQSENGDDYSVSEGGVNYCMELERLTPGVQGLILLLNRDGRYVAHMLVSEFIQNMHGIAAHPSNDEKFGPYWWVDKEFNFAGSLSRNPIVDQPPWLQ